MILRPYRDKLFVNCQQFDLTAHIAASRISKGFRTSVLSPDDARPAINVPKSEHKGSKPRPFPRGPVQQPDMKWTAPSRQKADSVPSGQYVRLYSRLTGKYSVVFAKIDATTSDAFIARRIVNSFGLLPTTWTSTSPSGNFVDLTCGVNPDNAYKSYRFRILDGCTFDICVGPELSTSQLPGWQG